MAKLVLAMQQFNNVLVGYVVKCEGQFEKTANGCSWIGHGNGFTIKCSPNCPEVGISGGMLRVRSRQDDEYFCKRFGAKYLANDVLAAIRKCVAKINAGEQPRETDADGFEIIQ